jgi:hypothetical protein|tara:strand:- start:926 stop:1270 length:345 start_codon:yes stop_codon:yes gene_type:complete
MKISSKFYKLIKNKRSLLENTAGLSEPPPEGVEVSQVDMQVQEPAPEPEVQKLTSEGELELIRLVKKALFINTNPDDIPDDIADDEINEKNGRQKLSDLKRFIGTYSDDPDIGY